MALGCCNGFLHLSPPVLGGLRWMKSHIESLLEEQDEGIQDKMAESQTPESRVPNFGIRDSVVCSEYQALGLQSPKPESWDLGVQDSIFRTKYQGLSYEPRTPNPEPRTSGLGTWDSGLGCPGLDIQDKVSSSKLRTPNPKPQTSELRTQASGTQYPGQSIELRVTSSKPQTSELGTRYLGLGARYFVFGSRDTKFLNAYNILQPAYNED
ncbi:hypothetical protein BDR05DRAFT_948945 [Suillus weaverae]|nr:hypothetical protein BDR05DRAFT_948945 [Suillus weaverae]